jgi:hypothetical protein
MIRIALLGNSHLENWKRAWNSLGKAYPDVDLVFFAAPGPQLECAEPRGDRLVFTSDEVARWLEITSGGRRELIAADYDAICVVGLGCGVRAVTSLYSGWRADAHKREEGRFQLVSDACFQDAVFDRLTASPAMVLVGKLRRITDKAIWLAPTPAPSEIILTQENVPQGVEMAAAAADASSLRATYDEACRRLAAETLMLLEQPKATLASPILSKKEYRRRNWTTPDWMHLNDAYGKIVIREFLSRLHPAPDRESAGDPPGIAPRLASPLLGALRSKFSALSLRRNSKS